MTGSQGSSHHRALRGTPLALFVFVASSGCAFTTPFPRNQVVTVKTSPEGARIWRLEGSTKIQFGSSPAPVHFEYEVSRTTYNRWVWWGFTGAFGAMAMGGAWWASQADKDDRGLPLLLSVVGAMGTTIGVLLGVKNELRQGRQTVVVPATLWASHPGYQDAKVSLDIPLDDPTVTITLTPRAPASSPAATDPESEAGRPTPATRPATERPMVAVFEVRDARDQLEREAIQSLTDILARQLASEGRYRVIPRATLRIGLEQRFRGGTRRCDTEACQLAIGRASTAQKCLDTRILSIGRRCRVTAVLYDLNTETADRTAAVRTSCAAEPLAEAIAELARLLSR